MAGTEELIAAVKAGDVSTLDAMLAAHPQLANAAADDGGSALLTAIYYGQAEVVEKLVAAGANPGLFEAAALGRVEDVSEIIAAQPKRLNEWSHDGFTPLQMASYFGQPEVVHLLLNLGADVHPHSRNPMRVTALLAACAHHRRPAAERIVELLLAHNADPNSAMEGGYTAIHSASQNGYTGAVRSLLSAGANPSARIASGQTALDLAAEKNHHEVVTLLRQALLDSG